MKWITSALLCVATLLVDASKPTATENLLTQLRYVNSQWLNQPEQNIVTQKHVGPSPKNYNEWITLHLQLVEKTLRERPCNGFSKTQIQHRHTLS